MIFFDTDAETGETPRPGSRSTDFTEGNMTDPFPNEDLTIKAGIDRQLVIPVQGFA